MLSFFCFAGVPRPKDQLGMHIAEFFLHGRAYGRVFRLVDFGKMLGLKGMLEMEHVHSTKICIASHGIAPVRNGEWNKLILGLSLPLDRVRMIAHWVVDEIVSRHGWRHVGFSTTLTVDVAVCSALSRGGSTWRCTPPCLRFALDQFCVCSLPVLSSRHNPHSRGAC